MTAVIAHRGAWNVDEPEPIRWLAGAGVDEIITNVPDVASAPPSG